MALAPRTYVGTWSGQAWQFPLKLVVQADDGQTVTLQWVGSQLVLGRATDLAPIAIRAPRQPDGSFTAHNPASDNAVENAHWCGNDLCATFYAYQAASRTPVVFKRIQ